MWVEVRRTDLCEGLLLLFSVQEALVIAYRIFFSLKQKFTIENTFRVSDRSSVIFKLNDEGKKLLYRYVWREMMRQKYALKDKKGGVKNNKRMQNFRRDGVRLYI